LSRSIKKGPYVDQRLLEKVKKIGSPDSKKVIKIYCRACTIIPEFVGFSFAVYNGKRHVAVYITEDMVGHKFGEFSPTRTYKKHTNKKVA
jgi:small subunit ribosomal protein S19